MGAWAFNSIENDDALDWLDELFASNNMSMVTLALDNVLNTKDYLDLEVCNQALAATEVVYGALILNDEAVNSMVTEWLLEKNDKGKKVIFNNIHITKTINVIKKILSDSELKELWLESEEFNSWQQHLSQRLTKLDMIREIDLT
jgi:hypothetical protein